MPARDNSAYCLVTAEARGQLMQFRTNDPMPNHKLDLEPEPDHRKKKKRTHEEMAVAVVPEVQPTTTPLSCFLIDEPDTHPDVRVHTHHDPSTGPGHLHTGESRWGLLGHASHRIPATSRRWAPFRTLCGLGCVIPSSLEW